MAAQIEGEQKWSYFEASSVNQLPESGFQVPDKGHQHFYNNLTSIFITSDKETTTIFTSSKEVELKGQVKVVPEGKLLGYEEGIKPLPCYKLIGQGSLLAISKPDGKVIFKATHIVEEG